MALGGWRSARSELLSGVEGANRDRGIQTRGSTTVLWEKSDILRLSSKEAQIKQFRVDVLTWKFPVQERR